MQGEVAAMLEAALAEADLATSAAALEGARVRYLGRKGLLTGLLRGLGSLPPAERPQVGAQLNAARDRLAQRLAEREAALAAPRANSAAGQDLTLPGRRPHPGSIHPVSQVLEEICDIFHGMGYSREDGPDVELDELNFGALNFPADHPSRDLQDTFYVNDAVVLRTQTSPVQVRTMRARKPPLAVVVPGRVYRQEHPDASHAAEFYQIEGLLVDRDVSLSDLKSTVHAFVRAFFGQNRALRFRPHFFPFTEPSVEVDLWWDGGGKPRWLEIMGAGMVHPHVFANCGYAADDYTGFAFGMGIDRIAMVRHGIPDIRILYENDARFLAQF